MQLALSTDPNRIHWTRLRPTDRLGKAARKGDGNLSTGKSVGYALCGGNHRIGPRGLWPSEHLLARINRALGTVLRAPDATNTDTNGGAVCVHDSQLRLRDPPRSHKE